MLIVAACDTATDDETEPVTPENGQEEIDDTDQDTTLPEDDDQDVVGTEDDDQDLVGQDDGVAEDDDAAMTDDEAAFEPGDEVPNGDAIDPEDLDPGAQPGVFPGLTLDEANELATFSVVEPESVPESLDFQEIVGWASPEVVMEDPENEEVTTVAFTYLQAAASDDEPAMPVELTQSVDIDMREGLPPETEQEDVSIGDREVTRIEMADPSGFEILAYLWQDGDVNFALAAILGEELQESDLEDMIASIPAD
jgi:hypothetical protein